MTMHPFHLKEKAVPPSTCNPSAKAGSGDIVEVTLGKDLKIHGQTFKAGQDMQVYTISLTASGILTGFCQTSSGKRIWVDFPIQCAKRIVVRGNNWTNCEGVKRRRTVYEEAAMGPKDITMTAKSHRRASMSSKAIAMRTKTHRRDEAASHEVLLQLFQ